MCRYSSASGAPWPDCGATAAIWTMRDETSPDHHLSYRTPVASVSKKTGVYLCGLKRVEARRASSAAISATSSGQSAGSVNPKRGQTPPASVTRTASRPACGAAALAALGVGARSAGGAPRAVALATAPGLRKKTRAQQRRPHQQGPLHLAASAFAPYGTALAPGRSRSRSRRGQHRVRRPWAPPPAPARPA